MESLYGAAKKKLGLTDEQSTGMVKQMTGHPDEEMLEFYDLIQVPIEIQEIGLDHFRKHVIELLG